jgi:hypothetical protein
MSDAEKAQLKEYRKKTATRLRLERASLFRVANEKKLKSKISEKEKLLLANFAQPGLTPGTELFKAACDLEILYRMHSSYYGLIEGYNLATKGLKLSEDRTRVHLVLYLMNHPKAGNKELVRYLDRKNDRLKSLRTRRDSPLWAWLPRSLEQKFVERGIGLFRGEFWETALRDFPKPTMEYLSRTKKMTKKPEVQNLLVYWPRVMKEHRQERASK